MGIVIRSSELNRPDRAAVAVARKVPGVASPPIMWPRWIQTGPNTGHTIMVAIHPSQIPAGWQSVRVSVPMRLATCEETDCPLFVKGWTEVTPVNSDTHPMEGVLSSAEAAGIFGLYGPRELAPAVVHHPAGTVCPGDSSRQPPPGAVNAGLAKLHPRAHKVPSGIPPIYEVNGRPTLWSEFEDSLGGGVYHTQKLLREGHD